MLNRDRKIDVSNSMLAAIMRPSPLKEGAMKPTLGTFILVKQDKSSLSTWHDIITKTEYHTYWDGYSSFTPYIQIINPWYDCWNFHAGKRVPRKMPESKIYEMLKAQYDEYREDHPLKS